MIILAFSDKQMAFFHQISITGRDSLIVFKELSLSRQALLQYLGPETTSEDAKDVESAVTLLYIGRLEVQYGVRQAIGG